MRMNVSGSGLLKLLVLLAVQLSLPSCSKDPKPAPPPPEVLVTEVKQEDVPIYQEFVGGLEASVDASIQARVQGYLTSQNYKEGSAVKKGDVLFQIDRRPFEAALAQAQAALAQAEAAQRQAELTAMRNVELFKTKAISEQERDNAVQTAVAARSQAEAQSALLQQAQLNLDFTSITAPVNGVAGFAQAQVGDLVGPSTGVLTTVSAVDPIKAFFTVSEQFSVQYRRRYADLAERKVHEKQLEFELVLSEGSTYPHKGELLAADNHVDVRTGSVRVAAVFPNPEGSLRPGQFARIRMRADVKQGALVVPQRAVTELQGTYQIAVVGPDNKASVRAVKVGERIDTSWIIDEGLQPGDRIVVEGVQKARDGVAVSPKPWSPPAVADKPDANARASR